MGFAVTKFPDKMPPGMPEPKPPVREVRCEYRSGARRCDLLVAKVDARGCVFTLRNKRWQAYEPPDAEPRSRGRVFVECPFCGTVTVIGEAESLF